MKIVTKIKKIINNQNSENLKLYLLNYIIERYTNDDEIIEFLKKVKKNGTRSCQIETLIAKTDALIVFDRYYNEIDNYIEDFFQCSEYRAGKNWSDWLYYLVYEILDSVINDLNIEYD